MNAPSPDDLIDQFCGYFRAKCDEIAAVNNNHFQRALYLALIDALGRARYPKGKNHERIVHLVQEHSGWPHIHRVSLSQLLMNLSHKKITQGALFEDVTNRLLRLEGRFVCYAASEPEKAELERIATEPEKLLVRKATYSSLLYPLRNILLHEFRIPGYGLDFNGTDDEPYSQYHPNRPRQTVFPPRFLHRLCKGCISGLSDYLKIQKINPSSCYEFCSQLRTR